MPDVDLNRLSQIASLTAETVAQYTGFSTQVIRAATKEGLLPGTMTEGGGEYRYKVSDLETIRQIMTKRHAEPRKQGQVKALQTKRSLDNLTAQINSLIERVDRIEQQLAESETTPAVVNSWGSMT
jgi:DNA-binding transcriptional MerR regulator